MSKHEEILQGENKLTFWRKVTKAPDQNPNFEVEDVHYSVKIWYQPFGFTAMINVKRLDLGQSLLVFPDKERSYRNPNAFSTWECTWDDIKPRKDIKRRETYIKVNGYNRPCGQALKIVCNACFSSVTTYRKLNEEILSALEYRPQSFLYDKNDVYFYQESRNGYFITNDYLFVLIPYRKHYHYKAIAYYPDILRMLNSNKNVSIMKYPDIFNSLDIPNVK